MSERAAAIEPAAVAGPGPWRRALRHRRLVAGLAVVAAVLAMALLAPHDPYQQHLLRRLSQPI